MVAVMGFDIKATCRPVGMPRLPLASDDTMMRLLDLYRHTNPALARLSSASGSGGRRHGEVRSQATTASRLGAQERAYFAKSAGAAAKFLAQPDGPN
jgi:hypothetical protein